MCDYLIERIKRETRTKTIQQSAYLLVKGLIKKKNGGDSLFDVLDTLFDIPKKEKTQPKTEEELIYEFEDYVKGA